jgi:hypothetical protein
MPYPSFYILYHQAGQSSRQSVGKGQETENTIAFVNVCQDSHGTGKTRSLSLSLSLSFVRLNILVRIAIRVVNGEDS